MNNRKDFLEMIKAAVGVDSQMEVFLKYRDFSFMLEPHGEQVDVRSSGKLLGSYKSFEEMVNSFEINGEPFIKCVDEIEFD